jgi:hypothetical protein
MILTVAPTMSHRLLLSEVVDFWNRKKRIGVPPAPATRGNDTQTRLAMVFHFRARGRGARNPGLFLASCRTARTISICGDAVRSDDRRGPRFRGGRYETKATFVASAFRLWRGGHAAHEV